MLRATALALTAALALLATAPSARAAAADSASAAPAVAQLPAPLLLDPTDTAFGSSVVFARLPNAADLNDLKYVANVLHVVVALQRWPEDENQLAPLAQLPLPFGADVVVLLPGYPPTHAAAQMWNHLRMPMRIVMLVDGPPADRSMIFEMNALHALTQVIATMPHPERTGFERLQRPLSFRVVMP